MKRLVFLKNSAVAAAALGLFGVMPKKAAAEEAVTFTPLEQASKILVSHGMESASPQYIQVGFKEALRLFPGEFPSLTRAVANMQPALDTEIHWVRRGRKGRNTTQIFRTVWRFTNTYLASDFYHTQPSKSETMLKERKKRLHMHLSAVERCLEYGVRQRWAANRGAEMGVHRVGMMGGWRELLGRTSRQRLRKNDVLILRTLRDLYYVERANPYSDYDETDFEWLSEISLEAYA